MANPIRIYRIPGAPAPGSNLPKIPVFGFSDQFDRADGNTLGPDWELFYPTGTPQFGISGGAARYNPTQTTPDRALAVREAHTADGVFRVILGASVPGNPFSGVLFRISSDNRNGLFLTNNGSTALRICTLQPGPTGIGTAIVAEVAGKKLDNNSVIEIVLSGPSVVVKLNGTQVLTYTDNDYKSNTKYGLYGYEADKATFRWNSAEVTL